MLNFSKSSEFESLCVCH